ncbi:BTB/POZ and MATH domain-containing protein 3-like [Carex rostrata]
MESLSMMAASGCYQFKINYSETKDMSIGKKITSPKFRFGQHDWVIYYYPQGINNKDYNGKYVSVFLGLQRESVDVPADFSFQLLDKHANIVSPTTFILLHHTFTSKEKSAGLYDCFEKTKLEQSYIKDECFVLRVSISVGQDSNIISSLGFPYESIHKFRKDNVHTDVTFDVDGKNFVAHRLILAAHSPVFRAEFFGSMIESNMDCIIKINEMIPSVFEAMLDFMYNCCICINDYKVSISSTAFLQHLVVAADRYEVLRLKVACEHKLIEKISLNTVLSTLEIAEIHNCEELKEQCLRLVVDEAASCRPVKFEDLRYHGEPIVLYRSNSVPPVEFCCPILGSQGSRSGQGTENNNASRNTSSDPETDQSVTSS